MLYCYLETRRPGDPGTRRPRHILGTGGARRGALSGKVARIMSFRTRMTRNPTHFNLRSRCNMAQITLTALVIKRQKKTESQAEKRQKKNGVPGRANYPETQAEKTTKTLLKAARTRRRRHSLRTRGPRHIFRRLKLSLFFDRNCQRDRPDMFLQPASQFSAVNRNISPMSTFKAFVFVRALLPTGTPHV